MKYTLKIHYQTGDSFRTETTEQELEGIWENSDILKENVQRIKDHWNYYYDTNSYFRSNTEYSKPSFYDDQYPESITLKLDNGNDWKFHAFWCGYFEKLLGVEVIKDDGIKGFWV